MAITIKRTAHNAASFLPFMTLSFRDLAFGKTAMDAVSCGRITCTPQASSICLCMSRHSKKWSGCPCLDCSVGSIDLVGNQSSCLCRSRSPSHWIGLAEGTRPQPTPTGINTNSRRLTVFLRATGVLKRSRRLIKFTENARRAGLANSSPEPHGHPVFR